MLLCLIVLTTATVKDNKGTTDVFGLCIASYTPLTLLSRTPLTRLAPLLQDNKCTKDVFGLCIGFAVVVGGYAIGPISGANLNPAVSWGITATHTSSFDNAVAYTIIQVRRPQTLVA